MLNAHIFLVILVTVILIIIAEYQKMHKIKWILLIGCVAYTLLTIIPENPLPISDEINVPNDLIENDIINEATINKPDSVEKVISDESKSPSKIKTLDILSVAMATEIV